LTSLALTHSILHSLVIPYIYSRFDIVWPENGTQTEARGGVDALTYGLATLVKAQEIFGEAAFQRARRKGSNTFNDPYPIRRRRLGNCYAQYTKKFSLGNGPLECVQEYLITKEAGKMLGTLVALAVARMTTLESFIWDMPTGVLRDVWLALSSLADSEGGCKLEKVWVRWHNNYQIETNDPPLPPPPNVPGVSQTPIVANRPVNRNSAQFNISIPYPPEHPSFSVLPPLKSLSVLEIDELVYMDEMSILIARSQHILKELRVGIAQHVKSSDWTANWEGDEYQQVDYDTTWTVASKIGQKRLQGVLGMLMGRVYNLRNNDDTAWHAYTMKNLQTLLKNDENRSKTWPNNLNVTRNDRSHSNSLPALGSGGTLPLQSSRSSVSSGSQEFMPALEQPQEQIDETLETSSPIHSKLPIRGRDDYPAESKSKDGPYLSGTLRLETLELEHIDLAIPVLRKVIDWPILTTLTLLHCHNHERLWRLLRDRYSNPFRGKHAASKALHSASWHYPLHLKTIHTNRVSSHLVSFIRDCLAPNTLETVFLQDGVAWRSAVRIEAIWKDVVKRHTRTIGRMLLIRILDDGESGHLIEIWLPL
jgi:hypothetical protein